MKNRKFIYLTLSLFGFIFLNSCGSTGGLNLFTIENDRELGAQVAAEIDNNPQEYVILDSTLFNPAYKILYEIRDNILNSGQVSHKDDFVWRLRIIKDDKTLNAFCTPGGYIYIYTGLIKFLDSEDELAGILAHEIAHADLRHSTRQLTNQYGVQTLMELAGGKNLALLKEISAGLLNLKFSRNHETEADGASVKYLCPTSYDAAGGAKFFEKLEAQGSSKTIEWLSTHPNPANRIEHFRSAAEEAGCAGRETNTARYQQLKTLIP